MEIMIPIINVVFELVCIYINSLVLAYDTRLVKFIAKELLFTLE